MADSPRFRTAPHPFPVGTEYYRAPMPPQEFWDRDFAAIRAAGMRIVRTFSYWNWMEPAPGRFELDDFDRFFELAARHDLLVWFDLTLATHGACPDWLLREHPDIRQVRPDGMPPASRLYQRHAAGEDDPLLRPSEVAGVWRAAAAYRGGTLPRPREPADLGRVGRRVVSDDRRTGLSVLLREHAGPLRRFGSSAATRWSNSTCGCTGATVAGRT